MKEESSYFQTTDTPVQLRPEGLVVLSRRFRQVRVGPDIEDVSGLHSRKSRCQVVVAQPLP